MSNFHADRRVCRHCGACVAECPVENLRLADDGAPIPSENEGEICVQCGHCVAVCPAGAISLGTMPVEKCEPLPEGWNLSLEKVEGLLKGRRSIRAFKKDRVPGEVLEKLIDVARYAPSGINRQPVFWSVVEGPSQVQDVTRMVIAWMKEQLAAQTPLSQALHLDRMVDGWEKGRDRVCRFAPNLVVAYALADDMTAPQAGTIALTYLDLAAAAAGLGTCWAGYVQMAANAYPPLKKFLGLRSRHTCLGAMMIGFPKYPYQRIPLRLDRRIKRVGEAAAG